MTLLSCELDNNIGFTRSPFMYRMRHFAAFLAACGLESGADAQTVSMKWRLCFFSIHRPDACTCSACSCRFAKVEVKPPEFGKGKDGSLAKGHVENFRYSGLQCSSTKHRFLKELDGKY